MNAKGMYLNLQWFAKIYLLRSTIQEGNNQYSCVIVSIVYDASDENFPFSK